MSLKKYDLFRGEVDLVLVAIARLKEFEPEEGYYLAFSGGKDSVVIKRLAEMSGVKFDAHYNLTTVDPPELVHFIKKHHKDVIFHRPRVSLPKKVMDKKFLPIRQQRWCCEIYKEGGGEGRLVMTGVRKAESVKRSKRGLIESCWRGGGKRYLNLIIDWEDSDVWEFIKGFGVPYCSLYDEGFDRLGCILCPMATTKKRLREMKRWPKIAAAWKRWTIRMYEKHKGETTRTGRIRFANFNSGEELFNWWIANKPAADPDQTVIFE